MAQKSVKILQVHCVVIGEDVQNVLMKISLALRTYSQKMYAYIFQIKIFIVLFTLLMI